MLIRREDADVRGGRQIGNEIREPLAIARGGQRVAKLDEHPCCGNERPSNRLTVAHGGVMPLVAGVEQREEVRGVGEGHDFFFGAPWR